jgi:pimeloyl-[acyl-carrier protein] synthase
MLTAKKDNPLQFDPSLPGLAADPYPLYHRLRAEDPVHWSPAIGMWVLTRYADAVAVLRDDRRFAKGGRRVVERKLASGPLLEVQSRWMLFLDPPDHERLRGLVTKAFTPRRVEEMRPHIQSIVDGLLDAVENGEMDVMSELACPLPVWVISEMLGVPDEEQSELMRSAEDVARTLDPVLTPDVVDRGSRAVQACVDVFRLLARARRSSLNGDLLSALITAEENGNRLTEDELAATCLLLFAAGHETTASLIGSGTLALLEHPDQLDLLRNQPSLVRGAVEECLRYQPSAQMTGRLALEDVEIGGKTIRKGNRVMVSLGAANRDPEVFPDPDRFDISRPNLRQIAFGGGIHFCLGAALARIEAQVALGTLVQRMPSLRLSGEKPRWRESFSLRGLEYLRVGL